MPSIPLKNLSEFVYDLPQEELIGITAVLPLTVPDGGTGAQIFQDGYYLIGSGTDPIRSSTLAKDTGNNLTLRPEVDGEILSAKRVAGTNLLDVNTSSEQITMNGNVVATNASNLRVFGVLGGVAYFNDPTDADRYAAIDPAGEKQLIMRKMGLELRDASDANVISYDPTTKYLTLIGAQTTFRDSDVILQNGGTETGRLYAATGNAQFDGTVTADTQLRGAIWASSWASLGITGGGGGAVQFAPAAGLYTFVAAGVAAGFTLDTMVPPGNSSGWRVEIFNRTGFTMTVVNNSGIGAAGEDIFTPSGANQAILNNGYALLAYDYDNLDGVGRGWRLLNWR